MPAAVSRPTPVVFLSDFGYQDEFTGICRAVINRIESGIGVIDLTHGIARGDVRRGALALAATLPYSAPSVFLAVVDPGVGTERRAVALKAGQHCFVGPDNGLLWPATESAGGIEAAFDISGSAARLEPTSRTFHGRDIFSPVAARLALGDDPATLGREFDPESVTRLELPGARLESDRIEAAVLAVDGYGNLALNAGTELIQGSFLRPGMKLRVRRMAADGQASVGNGNAADRDITVSFVEAFADVEPAEPLLYQDSSGMLSLAVNRGDAAARFGMVPDDQLLIEPA